MNANVVQQAANRTSTNRKERKARSAKAVAVTKVAPVSNAKAVAKAVVVAKARAVVVSKAGAVAKTNAVAKTKAKEAGETVAAAGRGGPRLTEANYTASVVREGLRSSHSLPTKRSNEESSSAQEPNELMKQLDEMKSQMKVRTTSIMLVVSYFVCFILSVYA